MNFSALLFAEGETASTAANPASLLTLIIPLALLGVVFYFFIYRPQKKQERETTEMRNSVEIGDIIATAGGIVGMVIKIKEDMILIETGGDRTKIQLQKWAIHSVLEKADGSSPETDVSDKKADKKTDKK